MTRMISRVLAPAGVTVVRDTMRENKYLVSWKSSVSLDEQETCLLIERVWRKKMAAKVTRAKMIAEQWADCGCKFITALASDSSTYLPLTAESIGEQESRSARLLRRLNDKLPVGVTLAFRAFHVGMLRAGLFRPHCHLVFADASGLPECEVLRSIDRCMRRAGLTIRRSAREHSHPRYLRTDAEVMHALEYIYSYPIALYDSPKPNARKVDLAAELYRDESLLQRIAPAYLGLITLSRRVRQAVRPYGIFSARKNCKRQGASPTRNGPDCAASVLAQEVEQTSVVGDREDPNDPVESWAVIPEEANYHIEPLRGCSPVTIVPPWIAADCDWHGLLLGELELHALLLNTIRRPHPMFDGLWITSAIVRWKRFEVPSAMAVAAEFPSLRQVWQREEAAEREKRGLGPKSTRFKAPPPSHAQVAGIAADDETRIQAALRTVHAAWKRADNSTHGVGPRTRLYRRRAAFDRLVKRWGGLEAAVKANAPVIRRILVEGFALPPAA